MEERGGGGEGWRRGGEGDERCKSMKVGASEARRRGNQVSVDAGQWYAQVSRQLVIVITLYGLCVCVCVCVCVSRLGMA